MSSALPPMIGQSPAFAAVLDQVSRLAPVTRPVLVIGERGTGKELIANRLHYLSPRWDKPFVTVNCAALADSLLDSELFGHEAGAFTGAQRRRAGRFEAADGGTLFLDEIATATAAVQEKLLRVIEYGSFERVGGGRVDVDVRVIAATNIDLPAACADGRFRADLLDRLAFEVVTLPPLRARPEDIPPLAEHFGRAMAAELGLALFAGFSGQALATLTGHDWPGNVRELRNAIERSLVRAADPGQPLDRLILDPFVSPHRPAPRSATPQAVPVAAAPSREDAAGEGFGARVAAFERRLLEEALAAAGRNQRRAAGALGLSYDQIRHLMRKHGLNPRR
ncbi:MAG: phage shock protein operon transcriptional activator [Alphaproteobacteria bacterium]|nr:phage shock protein operon transcriptional activator [Alphaproteobacteria bacterium]